MKILTNVTFKRFAPYACLLIIIAIGTFLRLHNTSPYLIYSDSYQPLMVAENIKDYGSTLAPLGDKGMLYPQYVGWSRPMLPLLINAAQAITQSDIISSAKLIVLLASALSIPIAYLLIFRIYKRHIAGLCAAALLALSYNHVVWSGFILTESLGVLLMLTLILCTVFIIQSNKTSTKITSNTLAGMALTALVATRYELVVLALPFIFILWRKKRLNKYTGFITIGVLALSFAIYAFVGAFPYDLLETIKQNSSIIVVIGIAFILLSVAIMLSSLLPKKFFKDIITNKNTAKAASALAVFTILCIILVNLNTTSLLRFIAHDFLLVVFGIIGTVGLLHTKRHRGIIFTGIVTTVILYALYHTANSNMERYLTYLIPLLLVASGEAAIWLSNTTSRKALPAILITLLFLLQTVVAFGGLHTAKDNIWFTIGYEEKAAKEIASDDIDNSILVVSMPEPYRIYTGRTVQSVSSSSPYLPISKYSPEQTLTIVNDAGMKEYFPKFYTFVQQNLSTYETGTFEIQEPLKTRIDVDLNPVHTKTYTLSIEQYQTALLGQFAI